MTIINLKEWATERGYTNYHIRRWVKDGLRVISERPYTTTDFELENYFRESLKVRNKRKVRSKTLAYKLANKLDYNDYLKGDYK